MIFILISFYHKFRHTKQPPCYPLHECQLLGCTSVFSLCVTSFNKIQTSKSRKLFQLSKYSVLLSPRVARHFFRVNIVKYLIVRCLRLLLVSMYICVQKLFLTIVADKFCCIFCLLTIFGSDSISVLH